MKKVLLNGDTYTVIDDLGRDIEIQNDKGDNLIVSKKDVKVLEKTYKKNEEDDYDDEQGEVPGEQDTGPDEYEEDDYKSINDIKTKKKSWSDEYKEQEIFTLTKDTIIEGKKVKAGTKIRIKSNNFF